MDTLFLDFDDDDRAEWWSGSVVAIHVAASLQPGVNGPHGLLDFVLGGEIRRDVSLNGFTATRYPLTRILAG